MVCMNPKRRPICRFHLGSGPLVASAVSVRDVFRVALLAEARSIACLRTQGSFGPPRPGLADGRLLSGLRVTAQHLNIELADYLVASRRSDEYHSWREQAPPA